MCHNKLVVIFLFMLISLTLSAQNSNSYKPDFSSPKSIAGYNLVWNDEFNKNGKPNEANWKFEKGFVRNKELQWYQANNANCKKGLLVIEGRKQQVKNPNFSAESTDWKLNRDYAEYTSASLQTRGLKQWQYGQFIIRAHELIQ
jgi:beta-glucanase (GH16 family)